MALKYWWLLPLGLAAMAAVVFRLWRRTRQTPGRVPVAHADRLTALPSYQGAVAVQRRWLAVGLASVLLLAGSVLAAAARPVQAATTVPEQLNRDIILCLDVSGSMVDTDEAVVAVFSELVTRFKGERIGLTIFDSTAVQVFPLTDDYGFVAGQLDLAVKALNQDTKGFDFFDGTYEVPGSSLIGDGLASCVRGFPPESGGKRSRSVILATDNMLAGRPVFTLAEAAGLAKKANVRVHALNPSDYGSADYPDAAASGLKTAATSTDGSYYALESAAAVKSIAHKVQATEAARLQGAAVRTLSDQPALPLGLALLSLAGLGAAVWKVRQ